MGEETLQDPRANYAYLDELDYRGWAWEFLRRCDDYRSDYRSLQDSKHPEHFDNEHKTLAKRWRLKRMMDPCSLESPEFFYERYENIDDLMFVDLKKWNAIMFEMHPPNFSSEKWKNSIICWDLNVQGRSLNQIAERLYENYEGVSHETRHHPARHLVKSSLCRFKELRKLYIKIAYK